MRGWTSARRIPSGIVHINDQTVDDEPRIPFGGLLGLGTGACFGGTANMDAFDRDPPGDGPRSHRPVPVRAVR